MKNVHGKFNSFVALGQALGIKCTVEAEKVHKCPNCGNELRKVGNTNVYVCDYGTLEDADLKETPVQVLTKCGTIEIDNT